MLKRRWLLALLLVAAIVASWLAVTRYRYRFVHTNADLLQLLPAGDRTLFYADVETLRRAGYLKLLSDAKPAAEYATFIQASGFDYTRDLDAVAAVMEQDRILLVARGRFDWRKLDRFAAGSNSVHLRQLQPDVLALVSGGNADALAQIAPQPDAPPPPSIAPIWLRPARSVLLNPAALPLPLRIFAISLQSADTVVLALQPAKANEAAFLISLNADFHNSAAAATAREQLRQSTQLLTGELAREHQRPSPNDLTGLLVSGTFEASGSHLRALWPVQRELLQSLQ